MPQSLTPETHSRKAGCGEGWIEVKSRGDCAENATAMLYLALPLSACVACGMLAVAVLARDRTRRESHLAAAVAIAGAWWAGCQVLWTAAETPELALALTRLSSPGWMTIGPLLLHLFLELSGHPLRRDRRALFLLYSVPACFVALDLLTPWIHPSVTEASWGWTYRVTPIFAVPYVWCAGTVGLALWIALRRFLDTGPPAHRRQLIWMFGGLAVPLVAASLTDGLAPLLGWPTPQLGTASITLLVLSIGWTFHRYGFSLIAPGAYATEILATLREGVAVLRSDCRVHSVNRGMARLLGVEPETLEGTSFRDRIDGALPAPDSPEQECMLLPPEGEPVPVSVCASSLRDKLGNPIGLVLVARDLREVAVLRNRLITSDRLASVGQLAAGIAHEINNPVAYVRANLGALTGLLDELPKQHATEAALAEARELIDECLDGVDRVTAIVRDVKGFSHSGSGGRESIELPRLLDSVLRVAAPQLRHEGGIVRDFGPTPNVRGSSQQLMQVFLNLVINASQAMTGDGEIRVVTRYDGDGARVEVYDEGCGIPADQLDRIFDPFFTTKPVGEGTGLGLSISYEIVRAHGGDVAVSSEPGQGTCVRVRLPADTGTAPKT